MAFILRWSAEAKANYDNLKAAARKAPASRAKGNKGKPSKQEGLLKQVGKTLGHLAANPRHPGLNTHKYSSMPDLSGKNREIFEAYAQNNTPSAYRVFWYYGPGRNEITIVAITSHP